MLGEYKSPSTPITSFSGQYAFLSNFYERGFRWAGWMEWGRSAEHYFQAECKASRG